MQLCLRFGISELAAGEAWEDLETRPRVITGEVKEQVEVRLLLKHSLDQISKKLASQGIMVSAGSIYQHLLNDRKRRGALWKKLRINGTCRYRRRNKVGRAEEIERASEKERAELKQAAKKGGREEKGGWEVGEGDPDKIQKVDQPQRIPLGRYPRPAGEREVAQGIFWM